MQGCFTLPGGLMSLGVWTRPPPSCSHIQTLQGASIAIQFYLFMLKLFKQ